MFCFPSDPTFIKLKKQFQELKILTSTYKSSYQAMVNIFPPNTSELDQPLSLNSDDTMFVIVTWLVLQKVSFQGR